MREHTTRRGDPTAGGSVRREIMTAYRQRALDCAEALRAGEAATRTLAAVTPDAPGILLRNVYGWFERVRRGTYRLTPAGLAALDRLRISSTDAPALHSGPLHRAPGVAIHDGLA